MYFLKQKSEAGDAFKKFKAFVEKQSGYRIKALRTDRGEEYLAGTIFKERLLKELGVKEDLQFGTLEFLDVLHIPVYQIN